MHSAITFPGIRDAGSEREYPAKPENYAQRSPRTGVLFRIQKRISIVHGQRSNRPGVGLRKPYNSHLLQAKCHDQGNVISTILSPPILVLGLWTWQTIDM